MESVYLKTLIEAVVTGSLTKAADSLCITPSAASRRIKFLEDQYGVPLLDRSGPLLVPTEAGKLVMEKAEKVLEIENELLLGLKGMGLKSGVNFCCTNAFGIAHLPEVLAEFMHVNPDTSNLKFFFDRPENILTGVRENIYDLGVVEHFDNFAFEEFSTSPLPDDEVVFISSPDLGIGPVNTSLDILVDQVLYGRNENCCASKFLEKNLKSMNRSTDEFTKHIIVDDLQLIINAVLEGKGIAFIPKGVIERHIKAGTIMCHYIDGFTHARKRILVRMQNYTCNPEMESLWNCIRSYFGSDPANERATS